MPGASDRECGGCVRAVPIQRGSSLQPTADQVPTPQLRGLLFTPHCVFLAQVQPTQYSVYNVVVKQCMTEVFYFEFFILHSTWQKFGATPCFFIFCYEILKRVQRLFQTYMEKQHIRQKLSLYVQHLYPLAQSEL